MKTKRRGFTSAKSRTRKSPPRPNRTPAPYDSQRGLKPNHAARYVRMDTCFPSLSSLLLFSDLPAMPLSEGQPNSPLSTNTSTTP